MIGKGFYNQFDKPVAALLNSFSADNRLSVNRCKRSYGIV